MFYVSAQKTLRLTLSFISALLIASSGMALPASPIPCEPQPHRLCLFDGRFSIEVDWKDHRGNQGIGQVAHASNQSGMFWFFHPDVWELHAKVLDACELNGHLWFFSAASTNVELEARVKDHVTGEERKYFNPSETTAVTVTDTRAFDACRIPAAIALDVSQATVPPVGTTTIELAVAVVTEDGLGVPSHLVEFKSDIGALETDGPLKTDLGGYAFESLTITDEDLAAYPEKKHFSVTASARVGAVTIDSKIHIYVESGSLRGRR